MLKCLNHPNFVNIINPTVVIDSLMERSTRVLQQRKKERKKEKKDFIKKNAHLCVAAVMFCKQCLAYTVQIDW